MARSVINLAEVLEHVEVLAEKRPSPVVVDRGWRGHGVETTCVLTSGTRKGQTPGQGKLLRRQRLEPETGRLKSDGRLGRRPLKGAIGDAIFAVLCGSCTNIRKILAHIRALITTILGIVLAGSVLEADDFTLQSEHETLVQGRLN